MKNLKDTWHIAKMKNRLFHVELTPLLAHIIFSELPFVLLFVLWIMLFIYDTFNTFFFVPFPFILSNTLVFIILFEHFFMENFSIFFLLNLNTIKNRGKGYSSRHLNVNALYCAFYLFYFLLFLDKLLYNLFVIRSFVCIYSLHMVNVKKER